MENTEELLKATSELKTNCDDFAALVHLGGESANTTELLDKIILNCEKIKEILAVRKFERSVKESK